MVTLKQGEQILAKCSFGDFDATLTTLKLVITSTISDEAFPLKGITGVGVYDDIEQYAKELEKLKTQNNNKYIFTSMCIGSLLWLIFISNHEALLGFFVFIISIIVGIVIAKNTSVNLKPHKILSVMQSGGKREFRYINDINKNTEIKNFVDKVVDTMS